MHAEHTTAARSREQRVAWEILRDSPTVRMLEAMANTHWPKLVRDAHFASPEPIESARAYYRRRSEEERAAAGRASNSASRKAHEDLAGLYIALSGAAPDRPSRKESCTVEHREALLDDALDDSFPASDPPAIVMPDRWNVRSIHHTTELDFGIRLPTSLA